MIVRTLCAALVDYSNIFPVVNIDECTVEGAL